MGFLAQQIVERRRHTGHRVLCWRTYSTWYENAYLNLSWTANLVGGSEQKLVQALPASLLWSLRTSFRCLIAPATPYRRRISCRLPGDGVLRVGCQVTGCYGPGGNSVLHVCDLRVVLCYEEECLVYLECTHEYHEIQSRYNVCFCRPW